MEIFQTQLPMGLYPLAEKMPCEPKDIELVSCHVLVNLGSMEKNEAAWWVLFPSVEHGLWVCQTEEHLQILFEHWDKKMNHARAAHARNQEEKKKHAVRLEQFKKLNKITHGLWQRLAKPPEPPVCEEVEHISSFTLLQGGEHHLANGMKQMEKCGFLRMDVVDGQLVYCPTAILARRAIKKQVA